MWSVNVFLVGVGWMVAAAGLVVAGQPSVEYRVTLVADPSPGWLEIAVNARELPTRKRPVTLQLEDFGEWTRVGEEHLSDLRVDPPLEHPDARRESMELDVPSRWGGDVAIAYRVPLRRFGTDEQRPYGLLPWRDGDVVSWLANNTLPEMHLGGEAVDGLTRRVTLRVPDGFRIASGWTGLVDGQHVQVDVGRIDQCPVYFTRSVHRSASEQGARRYEVLQLGDVEDITGPTLARTEAIGEAIVDATGYDLGEPVRVFISGRDGGGMRTDHGVVITFDANHHAPHRVHLLAHELFHEWLPGALPADGSTLVWFFEGFTEYLSLYCAARAGQIDRDLFPDRLLEIEQRARSSSAFGKTSFADPAVSWRDGDGPLETLAYSGGAMLAFHIDAELAERGESLAALLGEWMSAGQSYSLRRLRAALNERGLTSTWQRYIRDGKAPPAARERLGQLGFFEIPRDRPADLTYFGIETDAGVDAGEIVAIDPEGPNANRGLLVGDVIVDYGPKRTSRPRVREGLEYRFAYGLNLYALSVTTEDWYVDVRRDGKTERVYLEPWGHIEAGVESRLAGDPEKMETFFGR